MASSPTFLERNWAQLVHPHFKFLTKAGFAFDWLPVLHSDGSEGSEPGYLGKKSGVRVRLDAEKQVEVELIRLDNGALPSRSYLGDGKPWSQVPLRVVAEARAPDSLDRLSKSPMLRRRLSIKKQLKLNATLLREVAADFIAGDQEVFTEVTPQMDEVAREQLQKQADQLAEYARQQERRPALVKSGASMAAMLDALSQDEETETYGPATDADLEITEAALGWELPTSYKRFVTEFSNGAYVRATNEVAAVGSGNKQIGAIQDNLDYCLGKKRTVEGPGGEKVSTSALAPFSLDQNGNCWVFLMEGRNASGECLVAYFVADQDRLVAKRADFQSWLLVALRENGEVIRALFKDRAESELGLG